MLNVAKNVKSEMNGGKANSRNRYGYLHFQLFSGALDRRKRNGQIGRNVPVAVFPLSFAVSVFILSAHRCKLGKMSKNETVRN